MRCCRKRTNTTAHTSCAYRVATESFRLPFCVYVVINFLCMFIYDFSGLNLVSVPCTIHFLDYHLALEFCAAYVGLITFGDICASPGVVFVRYAPYICALQVRYVRYTCCPAVSEEACFVLNLPAILNLIWPGHPPFIGACERRFPMNNLLHVHYAMHVLYSRATREYNSYITFASKTGACAYKRGWPGAPRYNPQWRAHSKEKTLRHECQSLSHAL